MTFVWGAFHVEFAGDRASHMTMIRVDIRSNSGILRRDHDDRLAFLNELIHQLLNLAFRADVDAARRLVRKSDVAFLNEPFGT
jgi:hypothetical protein